MSEEEKDMEGLDRIDADEGVGTAEGMANEPEATTVMPRPEGDAGQDVGGPTDGEPAEGMEAPAAGGGKPKGGRRKAVCAAVAVVLVAGLGVGAALASRVPTAPETPAAATSATTEAATTADEDTSPTIQLGVTAEGWDAEGSSPVIAHVTNGDGTVDFYHAYDANEAEELGVDGAGTYKVSFISPVNSDGSIYKVGGEVPVEATAADTDADTGAATSGGPATEAATTGTAAGTTTTATFERVDAKDVTADDLNKVAEQVAEAVKKGDGTLSGDTGAAVVQKVADNAKANPNADAAKVEETSSKAQETAKSDESGAKVPGGTSKSNASSTNKSTSTAPTPKASGSSGSSSSSSSGSSSSSNGGSSSGSSQQASTPQKKWVAEQGHWETTYEQVWVPKIVYTDHEAWECSQCGATYEGDNAKAELSAHVKSTYKSESHPLGASAINVSYTTSEDQGHWESQATGQKWVVDVEGHWE